MGKLRKLFYSDRLNRKNGMIEFLRLIFCASVVLLHSDPLINDGIEPMEYGSYAVEFFFAVSGYLMILHIEKEQHSGIKKPLGAETSEFLWHKFKGLIPYLVSVFLIGLIIHYIFLRDTMNARETYTYFVTAFGELFLLRMSGIKVQVINGNLWYISAMLIVMLALYPAARKWKDKFTHIIAPFTAIVLLGWICRSDAVLEKPGTWTNLGHFGTVRAAAAICLGCTAYAAASAVSKVKFKSWFRSVLTVFEWLGYAFVLISMQYASEKPVQIMMIILTAVLVALSFSSVTYSCRFMNSRFFYALGKFSLPWYIYHYVMRYTLGYFVDKLGLDLPTGELFAIYIIGGLVLSAIFESAIRIIKKHPIKTTEKT